jgi:PTS system nitrogen regulatory IIA component
MNPIAQLLTPERSLCQARTASKKGVFELIADTLGREPGRDDFHPAELVSGLLAREKLGSTGLGGGIAIPHCRLRDCREAVGVIITLATPTAFDAPDDCDVDLLFALVVPQEATQEHLNLLAQLARMFSDAAFCAALRDCRTSEMLYNTTINWAEKVA